MASYAYTFTSGDSVTPTKLNNSRTISSIVNADIDAAAAIDKTKLNLSGAISNSDISATAAIDKTKLNLTGSIANADISATAAISDTKLATISTAGKVSNSATTATSANTASAIVARDASGNFAAGTMTGNVSGSSGSCTGNAATATAWATARSLSLTGDVTATLSSVSGSANVSAAATIANSAVTSTKLADAAVTGAAGGGKLAASAITAQTAIDAPASADSFLIYDDSTAALRKVTWSQVLAAAQPSGSILQVNSSATSIATDLNSTSITDTGITSVSITRSTATSKILLELTGGMLSSSSYHTETYFYVSHDGGSYADAGGGIIEFHENTGGTGRRPHVARYIYTPSTSVATIAAKVYYKVENAASYWHNGTFATGGNVPFVFSITEIK